MTDGSQPQTPGPAVDLATLTLDLNEITLGEMAAIETASGRDFLALFRAGSATRRLIALFLLEYRRSETPPSWRELSDRRPLAGPSSTSRSPQAGRRAKSQG